MEKKRYLTAREAAEALGISRATLYAYVSRGLVRSEETEGKSRAKRYRREDVEALQRRKALRRDPARAAETALHFGAPVLESAITLIAHGRIYYRGYDALHLAEQRPVEEVAALIWTGQLQTDDLFETDAGTETADLALIQGMSQQLDDLSPVEAFQAVLPLVAARDLSAYALSPAAVAQTGARILRLLTMVTTGRGLAGDIVGSLRQGCSLHGSQTADLLNAALILCADHELNVSSFTARCVASAGSTPYAVVMGGLAALQGSKHGGYTERVEALFREAGTPSGARAAVASRLKRGEGIPGFGHPLYPEGDPRGQALLQRVSAVYPDRPAVALARAIALEVAQATGARPNLDFGLVALTRALALPSGTALALFALGRTIGWLGQAMEQYQRDQMIRPRARYVGPQPDS